MYIFLHEHCSYHVQDNIFYLHPRVIIIVISELDLSLVPLIYGDVVCIFSGETQPFSPSEKRTNVCF